MTPVSHGTWLSPDLLIRSSRLEKRSQALRGRNLTRDIQADGAPMVPGASGEKLCQGPPFLDRHGTPELCLENPNERGFGAGIEAPW